MSNKPTYRYTPYELLLCRIDEDCDTEKHPNGQTKLFSYNADGFAETVNDEMHHLNDDTWMSEKLRASIIPIPMDEKPIHKTLLKIVENYISEEIKIAEETGYTDDICEGRRELAVSLQELLANARKEVADV